MIEAYLLIQKKLVKSPFEEPKGPYNNCQVESKGKTKVKSNKEL